MYFLENEENAKKKVFPNKLDLNVVSNPNKCERNNERFFLLRVRCDAFQYYMRKIKHK